MMMLTKENRKALPALYATEEIPAEQKKLPVKFFNPCGKATFWAAEFDGEDIFYGYVDLGDPDCAEWGYFSLSELMSIKLPFGLKIERDMHWDPNTTFAELKSGKKR